MKLITTCIALLLCANCSALSNPKIKKPSIVQQTTIGSKIRARVTYYCSEMPFGSKVAQPNIKKATPGLTIAAHPNFKFGTKVSIPGMKMGKNEFVVQDRGIAITRKVASHGHHYVFDVFCKSRKEMQRLARTMPEYMNITILSKP